MSQCCDRYLEVSGLGKETLKKASMPFLPDEIITEEDEKVEGNLREDCCKVLMKILYGARIARFDLLNATRTLASNMTKWTRACDKQLHRLVCYIHSTLDYNLNGYINDAPEDLYLKLYCDADFAGCTKTSRSTSGVILCLCGPNSWMPLAAISKKQGCVSHSTSEAELVAADLAVRKEGLPALIIWEKVLDRQVKLVMEEDNQAAIKVLESGYSGELRHMGRTHKVCLRWLNERVKEKQMELHYCNTQDQAADIFTKPFTEPVKWEAALLNIGISEGRSFDVEKSHQKDMNTETINAARLGGVSQSRQPKEQELTNGLADADEADANMRGTSAVRGHFSESPFRCAQSGGCEIRPHRNADCSPLKRTAIGMRVSLRPGGDKPPGSKRPSLLQSN